MDINKELDEIFNDPLLNISNKEKELFDIPTDMKKASKAHKRPDYYAQKKECKDFALFEEGFKSIHKELQSGKRTLIKTSKTDSLVEGKYYIIEGQMLLLQKIGELTLGTSKAKDGRTRCIYENGTETDILLQTLRKNVMTSGYAITDTEEEITESLMKNSHVSSEDKVTGYIYILSSLSTMPEIADKQNLYKIGFTINTVEERIADAANDPTYLLAPVKIEATYKIVNLNSHIFETLLHKVLDVVQMQISITDNKGNMYHPKEWYVVPLPVINTIINKILDGSITKYTYNPEIKCLEKRSVKSVSIFDTKGMKVLTLNIKKIYFDEIIKGDKKIEFRELKQTTLNKYTYVDETDSKRYLRRYDALRLYVGYNKNKESAIVEVTNITYNEGTVEFHLGRILEHIEQE